MDDSFSIMLPVILSAALFSGVLLSGVLAAAQSPHYLLAQVYRELHDPDASAGELSEFDNLSKSAADKAHDSRGAIPPESK
jgi:hypothetical protein